MAQALLSLPQKSQKFANGTDPKSDSLRVKPETKVNTRLLEDYGCPCWAQVGNAAEHLTAVTVATKDG